MKEVLPAVFHWTAIHDRIGIEVSSSYLAEEGVLLDPMTPARGLNWFREHGPPRHIVLTNRHHFRHSSRYVEAFGCELWCHESGLHEFTQGEEVRPFRFGDALPGGLEALEVGCLCPDETALLLPRSGGVLAVADGVIRDGDGPLSFVPDAFMGDDPEGVKRGLKAAYGALLEKEFDHLLLAHGHPWIGGAREALRGFVEG